MYEDAKKTRKHIYVTYSDFKGAFGGTDNRISFQALYTRKPRPLL